MSVFIKIRILREIHYGNGGPLVEVTSALHRGYDVPFPQRDTLAIDLGQNQKATSLEACCGIYGLAKVIPIRMADPGLMHALLAERLGVNGRDKFYQLQCFRYRIHDQSLRLPDAILRFYFVGDDPLLAMSELDTDDIEGLKQFCIYRTVLRQPSLKQSFATTLASSEIHRTPSTSGTGQGFHCHQPQLINSGHLRFRKVQSQSTRTILHPLVADHPRSGPWPDASLRTPDLRPRPSTAGDVVTE
ncbi:hypothetical protein PSPO01_00336 [Paraphaeosphaeria sporulosa]